MYCHLFWIVALNHWNLVKDHLGFLLWDAEVRIHLIDKQKTDFLFQFFSRVQLAGDFQSRLKKEIVWEQQKQTRRSPNLCISTPVIENEPSHQLINTIQFCLKFTAQFAMRLYFKGLTLAMKYEEISKYSFHQQHVSSTPHPHPRFWMLLIKWGHLGEERLWWVGKKYHSPTPKLRAPDHERFGTKRFISWLMRAQ